MRRTIIATLLALALAGWTGRALAEDHPAADNTGKNVRDRTGHALTPEDQPNKQPDLSITQQVRRAVFADKDLSANAHNVKIVTKNGVVTLRGPVDSAAEKATVAEKVKRVAGVRGVDNQLDVAGR